MNKTKHILLLVLVMIDVIVAATKLVEGDLRGCLIAIVIGAFALPLFVRLTTKPDNTKTK